MTDVLLAGCQTRQRLYIVYANDARRPAVISVAMLELEMGQYLEIIAIYRRYRYHRTASVTNEIGIRVIFSSFQWANAMARRPSSVCRSVCKLFAQIASSTRQMAGSPPNLHAMVSRWASIQGALKFKVKVKVKKRSRDTSTFGISQKNR